MTALIALVRKDLILFFANRRALILTLLMPVVLGAFFGFLFGGSGSPSNNPIEVAILSQDDSEISKKIVAGLRGEPSLRVQDLSLAEAKDRVLKGKLNVAILIPPGFGDVAGAALFGASKKAEIEIFYDPSQGAVLAMVKGMLTQQVMQHVSADMMGGPSGRKMVEQTLSQLDQQPEPTPASKDLKDFLQSLGKFQSTKIGQSAAQAQSPASAAAGTAGNSAGAMTTPFVTQDRAMSSGPKYNSYAHSFAGMCVQFILFMGIDSGISILLARRMGLWNRFRAAPISIDTILAARAISSALTALLVLAFVYAVAALFFKVTVAGSIVGFVGVAVCFALVAATFGLFIAAFGKTPEAARGLATFATLVMVMLGGAWVPAFLFPQWLQTVTLGVPTRWAVDGLDAMTWRGLPLEAALPSMAAMLGFSVLFGGLALWKFRQENAA